jgi:phage terminase large subunit
MTAPTASPRVVVRGAPKRLFREKPGGEVIISGPAGTGKTRAILEWINHRCQTEPNLRWLMLRKTQESLKASTLVTFTTQILTDFDGKESRPDNVTYYGGSGIRPADFTYHDTGSKIIMTGMDRISKVLSTEWDGIYVNEITELSLAEYEQLSARIDRPTMVGNRPPSILLGDCNPDAPTHWIKQRERDGGLNLWTSVHEDNPAMWDKHRGSWTESGQRYIDRLERLTGVRYQRLRRGLWVAAEGQVYDGWNPDLHLIDRFEIPAEWPRFWTIDFGYVHPFVWQWWAQGPDGALYRYREIYMTRRLVEDHAAQGLALSRNEPKPKAVITDHDAEDRATFEKHAKVRTVAAKKTVRDGIQAVAARLRPEANGRPRIYFLRDSLVERDRELVDDAKPTCTEEEFPVYVWADVKPGAERKADEVPVKEFDHGLDATRYAVAHFDLQKRLATARSF